MTLEEQTDLRLVCKSWNEEICQIIKKTCVARTQKCNRGTDTLSEFEMVVEAGAKLKLPCPFGGVDVKLSSEYSEEVEAISRTLTLPVVSLNFQQASGHRSFENLYHGTHEVFAVTASSLIKSCSPTLTRLVTVSWGTCSTLLSAPIEFPKLETLSVLLKDHNQEGSENSDQDEGSSSKAKPDDDDDDSDEDEGSSSKAKPDDEDEGSSSKAKPEHDDKDSDQDKGSSSEAAPEDDHEDHPGDGGGGETSDDEDIDLSELTRDKQPLRRQAAYFTKLILSSPNLKGLSVRVEARDSDRPHGLTSVLQLLTLADLSGMQDLTLELCDAYICKNPASFFAPLVGLEINDLRRLSISVGGGQFIYEIEPLDPEVLVRSINPFSHSLRTLYADLTLAVDKPLVFPHYPCLTTLQLPGMDFRFLDLRHLSDLKVINIDVKSRPPAFRQLKGCGSVETVVLSEPACGLRVTWGRDENANTVVAGQLFKQFPNAKSWFVSTAFLPAFAEYAWAKKKCVEKLSVHYTRHHQSGYLSTRSMKQFYDEATEACTHLSQLSTLRELAVSSSRDMDLGRIDLSELPNLEVLALSVNGGGSYSVLESKIEDFRKLKRLILFHTGSKTDSVPEGLRTLPNVFSVKTNGRVCLGLHDYYNLRQFSSW